MNVSAMTFEMTGMKIPKSEIVVLGVSRAVLLSVKLNKCKDVQLGWPSNQFIIPGPEIHVW